MIHAVYYCVLDSIMQIGIYRYYITLVIIGLMADSSVQYIMYPYRGDIKQFIQVEIRIIFTPAASYLVPAPARALRLLIHSTR